MSEMNEKDVEELALEKVSKETQKSIDKEEDGKNVVHLVKGESFNFKKIFNNNFNVIVIICFILLLLIGFVIGLVIGLNVN